MSDLTPSDWADRIADATLLTLGGLGALQDWVTADPETHKDIHQDLVETITPMLIDAIALTTGIPSGLIRASEKDSEEI